MAFEKIIIDDTRRAELTRNGFKWRRHNVQTLGAIGAVNIRIAALEAEAKQLGEAAANGLWDRAQDLRNGGAFLLKALIESDEALVRVVPIAKPKDETTS
ncbi:hypothetical protein K2P56_00520 [Patescibacteria group bacterium]|nr:hypothetical protein [Patescibacteria group bacterium]